MLYAHPDHRKSFTQLEAAGELSVTGTIQQTFRPRFTSSLSVGIAFAGFIALHVPAHAHHLWFIHLSAHDLREKVLLINTGNYASGVLKRLMGHNAPRVICESSVSPYAARLTGSTVQVDEKEFVMIGAWSQRPPADVAVMINDSIGGCPSWVDNYVVAAFAADGAKVHAVAALCNIRLIVGATPFYFYREGMGHQHIVALMLQLDDELRRLARALSGIEMEPMLNRINRYYGTTYPTLLDFVTQTEIHNKEYFCPDSLDHRFFAEDVAVWRFPYELAKIAKTPRVVLKWIVASGRVHGGEAFGNNITSLQSFGLTKGSSLEEVRQKLGISVGVQPQSI